MTMPSRPDQNVNPDAAFQLAQGFDVMVGKLTSLERVISQQTSMLERTINASLRYQMGGQPQMRPDVLSAVSASGGMPRGYTSLTQMTAQGAMTSLENLQAFTAQRVGQFIAGMPLYQPAGQPPPPPTGGGTPPGMPNSNNPPGAQNVQQLLQQLAQVIQQSQTGGGGGPAGPSGMGGLGWPGGGGPTGGGGGGPAPPVPPPGGPAGPGMGNPVPGSLAGMLQGRFNLAPNSQVLRTVQQFGARVAMGGGTISGLGDAIRSIPGVGLGYDIVTGGIDFLRKQREAARPYQQAEGTSNWQAQMERVHQAIYQASLFGSPMDPRTAGQAFGDVTAMGFNETAVGQGMQNRQSALDFIYHNFTTRGMDVNQSMAILQTASQNATVSLDTVSHSLAVLSETAGRAGDNANNARTAFNQYFQTALAQGAGPGAPVLAGGLATMQAAYGKQFANVNFGGEFSQTQQYITAGQFGITPAQYQYLQRTNPQAVLTMTAGQNLSVIQQLMSPQELSALKQMIGAAGGNLTPDLVDQIANQFLNIYQVPDSINLDIWAQVINSQTGNQLTAQNVMQWIVRQVGGYNEAQAAKAMGGTAAAVPAGNITGAHVGSYGLAGGPGWRGTLQSAGGRAAQIYLHNERRSGRRSPVLEALLQHVPSSDQVRVMTRNGPRVMSFTEAMRFYPQELISGNVEFYDKSGKVLGDTAAMTHGLVDPTVSTAAELRQKTGSGVGLAWAKWAKAHPGFSATPGYKSSAGGAPVTVGLTNEARQLLRLLPSNYNEAAASAGVPANPYYSQASR